MHLLNLYSLLTRSPEFSGHISRNKIGLMSSKLGKSRLTTFRQLASLEKEGLVKDCGGVWMACGANQYAATCGKRKCRMVAIPQNVKQSKDLRAFALSVIISEQFHRESKREQKRKRTQDDSDGFKKEISASFTKQYVDLMLGKSISRAEISSLRSHAKKRNWIYYMRRQKDLKHSFINEDLDNVIFGRNRCFIETPTLFVRVLDFSVRGVSNALKSRASFVYSQS